jgi:hypothetical protein
MSNLTSILASRRPAVTVSAPGDVLIPRAEWDALQAELTRLRGQVVVHRGSKSVIQMIIQQAAVLGHCSVAAITGTCRDRPLPHLRKAIYVVARGHEIHSSIILENINRSRTSRYHYETDSEALLEVSESFRKLVSRLEAACS